MPASGLAGDGPLHVESGGGPVLGDLGSQPCLPHAGRPGQDHAGEITTTEVLPSLIEDLGPPTRGHAERISVRESRRTVRDGGEPRTGEPEVRPVPRSASGQLWL